MSSGAAVARAPIAPGDRVGKWRVLAAVRSRGGKREQRVRCVCGRAAWVRAANLRNGQSTGCMVCARRQIAAGRRTLVPGDIVAGRVIVSREPWRAVVRCLDCGREKNVLMRTLYKGRGCGRCWRHRPIDGMTVAEAARAIGMSASNAYRVLTVYGRNGLLWRLKCAREGLDHRTGRRRETTP